MVMMIMIKLVRHFLRALFASLVVTYLAHIGSTTDNTWSQEDDFCDALTEHQLTFCHCVVSEDNRLSLLCSNEHQTVHNSQEDLENTLRLLELYAVTLSELTIANCDHLDVIRFEHGLATDSLVLLNLSRLHQVKAPPGTIQKLVVANSPNLELSSLFQFARNQTKLQSAYLSDLNLSSLRAFYSTPLATGQCLSLKHLSFNYFCNPTPAPLTIVPSGVLQDLCQIRLLDLSCLGIAHLENGSMPELDHHDPVRIELGWNRFSRIKNIQIRPPVTVNYDCNPLDKIEIVKTTSNFDQIKFEYHSC